jgi:FSR family fosmidomycin resistance protein-like MFS transporter
MRLFRQPAFLAVALSHFSVDILNGQVGVLLAVLSVPLRLNNASIGLIATTYTVVGSLSQPVFGWLSDRYGSRWTTAGGVLWMAVCFSLVALAPGYWAILFLIIGALGSAAFHPPGANSATQVGHVHMAGRAATAASLFFLFGQGGLSLGPAIGVDHLDRWAY